MKSLPVKRIKRTLSSLFFRGSVSGLLCTISVSDGGVFLRTEPLIVSVIIWVSLCVLFGTIWFVSVRGVLKLRTIGCIFAGVTALWLLVSFTASGQGLSGLLRAIAGVLMMGLLYSFIYSKGISYRIYRTVGSRRINLSGIATLGVGTAGVCALLTSVVIMKTPLQCEMIYEWYDKVIDSSLAPVDRSRQSLESLGEQSVFSVLQSLQSEESDTANEGIVDSDETPVSRRGSLQSTFTQAKQSLIDDTLEQRSIVTQNICQLILGQIQEIRKTATRNISIVVLLFAILSPLVTLWLRLVSMISRGVFKLLVVAGVFRSKKKLITVNEVE